MHGILNAAMWGRALFEKVVEMCGVSGVLGPGLVRRALEDGMAAPEDAHPADYEAALPQLHKRLRMYLPPDEAERRIGRIRAMLRRAKEGRAVLFDSGERLRDGVNSPPSTKTGETGE